MDEKPTENNKVVSLKPFNTGKWGRKKSIENHFSVAVTKKKNPYMFVSMKTADIEFFLSFNIQTAM